MVRIHIMLCCHEVGREKHWVKVHFRGAIYQVLCENNWFPFSVLSSVLFLRDSLLSLIPSNQMLSTLGIGRTFT